MLTVASQLVDVTPVGHRTVQVDAAWAPNSMVYSISLAVATKDAIADAGTLAKLNSVSLDLEISATIMRGTVLAGQNKITPASTTHARPFPTVVVSPAAKFAIFSTAANLPARECLTAAKIVADAQEPTSTNASGLNTELPECKAASAGS